MLWSLVVIGAILALAYVCTRFVASRGVGERLGRGNRITVLEKVPVGKDQRLLLVKLGEEYYFLGAGPSGITCLGKVSGQTAEEWDKEPQEQPAPMPFRQALEQVMKQRKDKGGH